MISIRYYFHNKANKNRLHPLYMSVHLDGVARLQQAVGKASVLSSGTRTTRR